MPVNKRWTQVAERATCELDRGPYGNAPTVKKIIPWNAVLEALKLARRAPAPKQPISPHRATLIRRIRKSPRRTGLDGCQADRSKHQAASENGGRTRKWDPGRRLGRTWGAQAH